MKYRVLQYMFIAALFFNVAYAYASPSAIASAHRLATEAGHEILSQGGNAFDAAVAVTSTLSVVEPYSSGIGGGGFALIYRASDSHEVMIDAREAAPKAARRDMYLDKNRNVIQGLSIEGALSAGIPGTPALLAHMAKKYGKLPLEKSLSPAIRYAEKGFPVTPAYQRWAQFRIKPLNKYKESARIFLRDNKVPAEGEMIRQPELARTLRLLARNGASGFYAGEIAKRLVSSVQQHGGIWSLQDLKDYRVIERKPLKGEYRGMKITTVGPPSSGGIALLTILNILSGYELEKLAPVQRKHLVIESMRRAYRDRAIYLGDPAFVTVPVARLLHPFYADGLRASINPENATPSELLPGIKKVSDSSLHTTHFSVVDSDGNRVSSTMTINYPFGSGLTVPGTGVLLNDEMDDFSSKPGEPNAYGLVGNEANAIAPGKRPLSSMTPTFLEKDGRIAVLGTPGGSRIISMVMLAALQFFEGNSVQAVVSNPRYHHQYLPDAVQYEPAALTEDDADRLQLMGHSLKKLTSPYGDKRAVYGNMHAIVIDKRTGKYTAASDPRGEGMAMVK